MPADLGRGGEPGFERVGDVVLPELSRPPARHVELLVVQRQVDVSDQRRHRLNPCSSGGQVGPDPPARPESRSPLHLPLALTSLVALFPFRHRSVAGLPAPVSVLAKPHPHRRRQSPPAESPPHEPIGLARIAGGAQLQRHLVLVAQGDLLLVLAFPRSHTWSASPYFPPSSSSGDDTRCSPCSACPIRW